MSRQLHAIDRDALAHVTGGGWKGKAVKAAWELTKWTGIPAAIGGGAAWVKRQFQGDAQPPQPPQPQPGGQP